MISGYLCELAQYNEINLMNEIIKKETDANCDISSSGNGRRTILTILLKEYGGHFYVQEFPNNCSWIVVTQIGSFAEEKIKITECIAKKLKYANVFLSIPLGWTACRKTVESLGYKMIHSNINLHSQHEVGLFIKEIK
jgi:hypothetical protein